MAAIGHATNKKCVLDDFKGKAIFNGRTDKPTRLELCQKDSYFMMIYENPKEDESKDAHKGDLNKYDYTFAEKRIDTSYLLDLKSVDIINLKREKCRLFTDGDVIIYTVDINQEDDLKLKQIAGFDVLKKATIYLNKIHDLTNINVRLEIIELPENLEVKIPKNFWKKIKEFMKKDETFGKIINDENAKIQILKKISTIIYEHEEIINENEKTLIKLDYKSPGERTQLDRNIFRAFISLQEIDLSGSSIGTLDSNLLKGLKQLVSIDLSSNKISCIMKELFNNGLEKLTKIDLQKNQIIKLPADLNLTTLQVLNVSFNEVSNLEAIIFKNLTYLNEVYFNNNSIKELNRELFQNNTRLEKVQFNDNKISNLPFGLFMRCVNLTEICFSGNNIEKLDAFIFRGLLKLTKIDFSYNKISELNSDIFTGLEGLKEVDFSYNRISRLHPYIFKLITSLDAQQSTTAQENEITVDFRFDYENTIFLSWDYLRVYNEFFRKNPNGELKIDDEVFKEYMIMLILSEDKKERKINTSDDVEISLIKEKEKVDNEILTEYFVAQSGSFIQVIQSPSFTLLDFFLLCKGISTKMLESILKKVNSSMKELEKKNWIKFRISNYKSVERLCESGNQKLIQDLEDYFNFNNLSFKKCIDVALKKNNESVAIGFVNIFWNKIKDEYKNRDKSKMNFQDIVCRYEFYLNDYLKRCFNIEWWMFYKELLVIYEKDKEDKISRFYLTFFEKDYTTTQQQPAQQQPAQQQPAKQQPAQRRPAQPIQLSEINEIENHRHNEAQQQAVQIQFDETNPENAEKRPLLQHHETKTIEYQGNISRIGGGIIHQISSEDQQDNDQEYPQVDNQEYPQVEKQKDPQIDNQEDPQVDNQDKKQDDMPKKYKKLDFSKINNIKVDQHLLYFINKSERDELIRDNTTKKILKLKWKRLPQIFYYLHLILYVIFLILYVLYTYNDKNSNFDWKMNISLGLLVFFTIEEIYQFAVLGLKYFKDLQNCLEMFTFILCFFNLLPNLLTLSIGAMILKSNDVIYVVTIITSFGILILRLKNIDKASIGVYATVFEKVILKSFNVIPLVTLSLFAFVFAFNVTRKSYDFEENKVDGNEVNRSDEDHITLYNGSFEYNLIRVLTMSLGEYTTSKMGLVGQTDIYTIISNYIAYILFIFILPILVINMFIGISVDEMRNLIEKSENQNIKIQIEYVLNIQKFVPFTHKRIIDKCKKIISKEKKEFNKLNKIKDELEKTYRWYSILLNKLDRTITKAFHNDKYCLNHYKNLLEDYKKKNPKNPKLIAKTLYNIGLLYEKSEEEAEYNKALGYFKEALEIRKRILGLNETGRVKKELEKTFKWYSIILNKIDWNKILFIGKTERATYHNYCLQSSINLLKDCNYKLEDYKKQFPLNSYHIVTTLYNIGLLYEKLVVDEAYNNALEYFKEALEIRRRIIGIDEVGQVKKELEKTYKWYSILLRKLDGTNILFNMGNKKIVETDAYLKNYLKHYEMLLGHYQLGDYKKQLPENPNHIVTTIYNIGLLYEKSVDENDYKKALGYFKEALEIRKRILGISETGRVKKELEKTFKGYSNPSEKLDRANILLEMTNKTVVYKTAEFDDSYLSAYLKHYGMLLGDYILGDYKKQLPENPNHLVTTLYNIGLVYEKSTNEEEYNNALVYFKEALEIRKQILADSVKTKIEIDRVKKELEKTFKRYSILLNKLGILFKMGIAKSVHSDKYLKRYLDHYINKLENYKLKDYEVNFPRNPNDISTTLYKIGLVYEKSAKEEQYNKALDYFKDALEIRKQMLADSKKQIKSKKINTEDILKELVYRNKLLEDHIEAIRKEVETSSIKQNANVDEKLLKIDDRIEKRLNNIYDKLNAQIDAKLDAKFEAFDLLANERFLLLQRNISNSNKPK